jgi:hypothetical protein
MRRRLLGVALRSDDVGSTARSASSCRTSNPREAAEGRIDRVPYLIVGLIGNIG